MEPPFLRRLLLDLIGTAVRAGPAQLERLSEEDWTALDRMAGEHRLRPLLHVTQRDNPVIPQPLAELWREAHRFAALTAMVQRAELGECCALLSGHGFVPVALKGAWLAWHAYPEPAQRPLRDLDILVTQDTARPAFEMLVGAGYRLEDPPDMEIEDIVRLEKHMPPLIAPRGTRIELHHRMWERDGRLDHATPAGNEAAVRARTIVRDGIAYPAPEDMLAHLIVHAVYSHRLDCGPLVLSDLRHLLARETIDTAHFWQRATNEGWAAGAHLLFALVRRYHGENAAPAPPAGTAPLPDDVLEAAPDLLLQSMDTRHSAHVVATALAAGPAAFTRRLAGKTAGAPDQGHSPMRQREGGFLRWAMSRLRRTLGDALRPGVMAQSRDLGRLSRWLDDAGSAERPSGPVNDDKRSC